MTYLRLGTLSRKEVDGASRSGGSRVLVTRALNDRWHTCRKEGEITQQGRKPECRKGQPGPPAGPES